LHRFREATDDISTLSREDQHLYMNIGEWSTRTSSGDLNELFDLSEHSSLKTAITSTTDNCLGQECDFYDDCFVLKARRRAQEAKLVIANHHLLMADLSLKEIGFGEILPKADTIIFDEAHQLPELAAIFFGTSLSSRQITEFIKDCQHAFLTDASDISDIDIFLNQLVTLVQKLRLVFGRGDIRVSWSTLFKDEKIKYCLRDLQKALHDLEEKLDQLKIRSRALDNCWQRIQNMIDFLNQYQERQGDDQVQWLETRGHGFLLHKTPLDISGIFQQRLSQHDCLGIYTSATLAVDTDFSYFARQLGLEDEKSLIFSSPFDFRTQALMYLPEGLPPPGSEDYTDIVLKRALPIIMAGQGHAFMLFTSHKALQDTASLLRNQIDYPLMVQGEASRSELLDRFRKTPHSVLLGTSSFWEGVDVKGDSLTCVIINKLPFMPPDDPVFIAKAEKMEVNGKNPFIDYQLPQAIITLKQGIGRLIRDRDDYGVMMICDPRIKTRSYGKKILRSLPDIRITSAQTDVEEFIGGRYANFSTQA